MELSRYSTVSTLGSREGLETKLARFVDAWGTEHRVVLRRWVGAFVRPQPKVGHASRIVSRLSHPNVVTTIELGQDGFDLVAVTTNAEALSVGALTAELRRQRRPMPEGLALRLMVEVLKGLEALHSISDAQGAPLGVFHRALNSANALLTRQGQVLVADAGVGPFLAKPIVQGLLPWWGRWWAPELVNAEPADVRSDVFAAGLLLFELLTGSSPHEGRSDVEVAKTLRSFTELPRVNTRRPDVAPELNELLARALSPRREQRLGSATDFRQALEALLVHHGARASQRDLAQFVRTTLYAAFKQREGNASTSVVLGDAEEPPTSVLSGVVSGQMLSDEVDDTTDVGNPGVDAPWARYTAEPEEEDATAVMSLPPAQALQLPKLTPPPVSPMGDDAPSTRVARVFSVEPMLAAEPLVTEEFPAVAAPFDAQLFAPPPPVQRGPSPSAPRPTDPELAAAPPAPPAPSGAGSFDSGLFAAPPAPSEAGSFDSGLFAAAPPPSEPAPFDSGLFAAAPPPSEPAPFDSGLFAPPPPPAPRPAAVDPAVLFAPPPPAARAAAPSGPRPAALDPAVLFAPPPPATKTAAPSGPRPAAVDPAALFAPPPAAAKPAAASGSRPAAVEPSALFAPPPPPRPSAPSTEAGVSEDSAVRTIPKLLATPLAEPDAPPSLPSAAPAKVDEGKKGEARGERKKKEKEPELPSHLLPEASQVFKLPDELRPPERAKNRTPLFIGLGLLVVVLGGGAAWKWSGGTPAAVDHPTLQDPVAVPAAVDAGLAPAAVVVKLKPISAQLSIDGERVSSGRNELDPGPHVITAEAQGWLPGRVEVVLDPGETRLVELSLQAIAKGTLELITTPKVTVSVEGLGELGETPLTVLLTAGPTELHLTNAKLHIDTTVNIDVKASTKTTRKLKLK